MLINKINYKSINNTNILQYTDCKNGEPAFVRFHDIRLFYLHRVNGPNGVKRVFVKIRLENKKTPIEINSYNSEDEAVHDILRLTGEAGKSENSVIIV